MSLPEFIAPIQPPLVKEPFDSRDWIFEAKLDGYRAIAVIDSVGRVRICSRNRMRLDLKFPIIEGALEQLDLRSTILDREIVALDNQGNPALPTVATVSEAPNCAVSLLSVRPSLE